MKKLIIVFLILFFVNCNWIEFYDTDGKRISDDEFERNGGNGKTVCYVNKVKDTEIEFKNGEIHGKYTMWHKNGEIKLLTEFKDGKEHGKCTEWDENGNVISEEIYENGKLTKKIK